MQYLWFEWSAKWMLYSLKEVELMVVAVVVETAPMTTKESSFWEAPFDGGRWLRLWEWFVIYVTTWTEIKIMVWCVIVVVLVKVGSVVFNWQEKARFAAEKKEQLRQQIEKEAQK